MKIRHLVLFFLILAVGLFTACEKKQEEAATKKIKAGFVYVGPVGDYGWSHAHDVGRKFAEKQLPWLETVFVESVAESDSSRIIVSE